MITDHTEYITKEKQRELMDELTELKTVARKQIAEKLDFARELGDLSENAEYHDARDKQAELESRIESIENILNTANIITNTKSKTVTIGSKVTIQKVKSTSQINYEIVGSAEANMLAHKLSHESPLGKAMLGKKVGDTVTLTTPNGVAKYSIKKLA